jgi:hypothetical protein
MQRTRFKEEQIIAVLREAQSGTSVKDLCPAVMVDSLWGEQLIHARGSRCDEHA